MMWTWRETGSLLVWAVVGRHRLTQGLITYKEDARGDLIDDEKLAMQRARGEEIRKEEEVQQDLLLAY